MTDVQAIKDGAYGQQATGAGTNEGFVDDLRQIYAQGGGVLGPGKVGNAELQP